MEMEMLFSTSTCFILLFMIAGSQISQRGHTLLADATDDSKCVKCDSSCRHSEAAITLWMEEIQLIVFVGE